MAAQRVLVVLFDGVQSLDVTGPVEVLAGGELARPGSYTIHTGSIGGVPVRTSSGLRLLPDVDLTGAGPSDLLIVPGGTGTRTSDPRLVGWLRDAAPAARRVASVCTGAFLLAEAGLLDGRRATTHWRHAHTLARRFPRVTVDTEPIFVRDGTAASTVWTSAGVTAGIDLALAVVEEDHGRDVALEIARHLVMFVRRPGGQRQFSAQLAAQVASRDPLREVQRHIAEHPSGDLTVDALARLANLSPRQFSRAFAAEVGTPPGRYVDRVRLETARRHLEEGAFVEEAARACGYGTSEAMRRAFVRTLGVTPTDYKERFSCR
ncbi:GlxA family transcriptional regulator [Dactylosporangium sp. NPDC049525]|uniref:GlxA family transcriptional regulator n=1 Tax=Dactylosporangium sp. NPDC049525 TaxID=3154730 RepID=UPI00342E235A